MKKHLLKKISVSFIMIFLVSYLHAQCPGNKVKLYKPYGRFYCTSKCVSPNAVQSYLNSGWSYICKNHGPIFRGNSSSGDNKTTKKNAGKIPANSIASTKK